jgi:hypothetical protein
VGGVSSGRGLLVLGKKERESDLSGFAITTVLNAPS